MKKSLLILAAVAFVASSCTKTEVIEDTPKKGINFSAYTAKPTRAAQVDVTTDSLTQFKVTAFGNGAIYFDNVTFTKSRVWESATKYFWPAFPLTFCAYNTPTQGGTTFNRIITTSEITPSELKLFVVPNSDLAKQEDLVAAYAKDQKEGNATSTESSLPILFNHYLTQVIVKAKNSSTTYKVVVDSVKLANLAGDGTYTFRDSTMTATVSKVNKAASSDYKAGFRAKELNGTPQEVMTDGGNGKWYLIPQTVRAWKRKDKVADSDMTNSGEGTAHGTYLALKVKITANGDTLKIYPATGDESGWMAVPIPTAWTSSAETTPSIFAQGKKYTIILDFFGNNGAGYVDPETPSDLDGDNATDDNGKKIIGGAIKFKATVNDWANVDITISL